MSRTCNDLTGKRYGRLVVTSFAGLTHSHGTWICMCDCGGTKTVVSGSLRNGLTKSCGCLLSETSRARLTTHGRSTSLEYRAWSNMMARCYNPKSTHYRHYGGRGISVCNRWHTPELFLSDMGKKPDHRHTLERKNTDGNYEKSNCVWATWVEQQNNKRSNLILEHNGKRQSAAEWERELGIPNHILSKRMRRNWSQERALTTPPAKSYV